jgi:hypothetical protein
VIHDKDQETKTMAANVAPPPPYEPDPNGPRAKEAHPGLQVLGDLSEDQLNRLMASMAEWVAPEEGCTYCHNPENMADYSKYQIQVARRMLQMTRTINADWKQHVGEVGRHLLHLPSRQPRSQERLVQGDRADREGHGLGRLAQRAERRRQERRLDFAAL